MRITERSASGLEALALGTTLLQRARLADSDAGIWEAADLQWWWSRPKRSDAIDQRFWFDGDGPIGAAILTDWGSSWGCDLLAVPGSAVPRSDLLGAAMRAASAHGLDTVEMLVRDDDSGMRALVADAGFSEGGERSAITWMRATERPTVARLPDGFAIMDRERTAGDHPMRSRSGPAIEQRLNQCSLYDPWLDLAVEGPDGVIAAYALFWADPVTRVGLVEPMRVEDAFRRRGLGRALLTAGIARLAARQMERIKVGFENDAARDLYLGVGFAVGAWMTAWRWSHART